MKIGKLELLKLQGFKLVEKNGEKYIYAKLSETRLFYSDPNKTYGSEQKPGTGRVYLDLVMFETPNGHSDYAVSESKKKDEQIDLSIIGNFNNYRKQTDAEVAAEMPTTPQPESDSPDKLPF